MRSHRLSKAYESSCFRRSTINFYVCSLCQALSCAVGFFVTVWIQGSEFCWQLLIKSKVLYVQRILPQFESRFPLQLLHHRIPLDSVSARNQDLRVLFSFWRQSLKSGAIQ